MTQVFYAKPIDESQPYTVDGISKMPKWWGNLPDGKDKKWLYAMVQAGLARIVKKGLDSAIV